MPLVYHLELQMVINDPMMFEYRVVAAGKQLKERGLSNLFDQIDCGSCFRHCASSLVI